MKRTFSILFPLIFTASLLANDFQDLHGKQEENCRLLYPKFIPINSSFDIAIIASNNFPLADKLELYILPDEKINLNKVELRSTHKVLELNYSTTVFDGYNGTALKTKIDLTDSTLITGTFFQVLINFKSDNTTNSILKFVGIFKSKDLTLGYLKTGIEEERSPENKFLTVNLKFYKPQKIAGRSVQLNKNSSLKILPHGINTKNLLSEFWIKFNESDLSFLRINNQKKSETEFELFVNSFQMLSIESEKSEPLFVKPFFISRKNWYHITVLFSFEENIISFYSNDNLLSKNNLTDILKSDDVEFEFISSDKIFQMDIFRLVDFNNSIEVSFENKNYTAFLSDSSTVVAQLKFDSNDEFSSLKNKLEIKYGNFEYIKSDAPVFARAPELNINMLGKFYELEWTGGDFKQASFYVLEKSMNNSKYDPIFQIQADNASEKFYSYLDRQDESSDIIYYRVKQVNIDGSSIYSAQVKVGQGLMEPFMVEQNYPNPFNPKTSIEVDILEDNDVEITVYNLEGSEIAKLFKGHLTKGVHKFTFDATGLPSGIYLYKILTSSYSQTKKMILTK